MTTAITSQTARKLGLAQCFHGNRYVVVAGGKMTRSEVTASCGPAPHSLVGSVAANLELPSKVWDSCNKRKKEKKTGPEYPQFFAGYSSF